MADTVRGTLILFSVLFLAIGLAAGCGSDDAHTSPVLDAVAPAMPLDLSASASGSRCVELSWSANSVDPDLAGYIVYRSIAADGGYRPLNSQPLTTNAYTDPQVADGRTYWYAVTAVDVNENESAQSPRTQITAGRSASSSTSD